MSSKLAAIIQSDRSVLLEVEHPGYERAREVLSRFAELETSPEHVHTYRLSALALWNAAAQGATADEIVEGLAGVSRFELPGNVVHEIRDLVGRHGVCQLEDADGEGALRLTVCRPEVRELLVRDPKVAPLLQPCAGDFTVRAADRGAVKRALLGIGYPVDDRAGLRDGEPLTISLRSDRFEPYPYQRAAVRAFEAAGGHGVVVLPCGAGKTVVAMMAAAALGTRVLVLVTGREAAQQWRREFLDKTGLAEHEVAVYAGGRAPSVGPVAVASYSMLSQKGGDGPTGFRHFDRLAREPWGLIVYDEVHLLPAPMFRLTAELQARRRLGLTATLVREDGREGEAFALIGPKRYEVPWRELEASGHIAAATCYEVRVRLPRDMAALYAASSPRERPRVAADNPIKLRALEAIAARHSGDRVLVMGTYLESLRAAANILGARLVEGSTPHAQREAIYGAFRRGDERVLALSKVGNFAIDLPDANVLIQLSGTMGSRQEEAQRLGRVLRPKPGGSSFYNIVTRDTIEQANAHHRQLFLTEQGYRYFIEDWRDEPREDDDHAPTLH